MCGVRTFEFCEVITRAIAQGEISSVERINNAVADDWRAAAWMLERRYFNRWANTQPDLGRI